MKKKNLWARISYITVSGVLAATVPAASVLPTVAVVAKESDAEGTDEGQQLNKKEPETQSSETQPTEAQPSETQPTETQPSETQPSETQPSETQPSETQPSETQPTETQPSETQPTETQPAESETTTTEPQTEPAQPTETQPSEAQPAESETTTTEPQTEPAQTETVDTEPETEPQTGSTETESETVDTETETESLQTETVTAPQPTETESDTDKQTETIFAERPSETVSEQETESETGDQEDHSILNANWATNIIASNAAYLGQLSSAYGISISSDFTGICAEVEKEFAGKLADPENFHATNWRDVLAVFIYELKEQTGSAEITADSKKLLLQVFTKMNAPEEKTETVTAKVPELSEVFVEEYPIDDQMAAIDRQEQIMLEMNARQVGVLNGLADAVIHEKAEESRAALREKQKTQMDAARYEKWLRLKQKAETTKKKVKKNVTHSAAEAISRSIDDYVKMEKLSAGKKAEIERYGSVECLQLCAIASADPVIVRASVGDGVSEERVQIVTAAYSLVGKVGYFWGGKSQTIGWDSRWGSPATVTAKGSTSTGMTRNYGLDCSGYVQYCYYNGLGGNDGGIGGHTTTQWNASEMVDQAKVLPGDLVFYGGPERGDNNHVGVVVGKSSDGGLIVAHCSSSRNGVVVGEAWSSGFRYVRTVRSLQ